MITKAGTLGHYTGGAKSSCPYCVLSVLTFGIVSSSAALKRKIRNRLIRRRRRDSENDRLRGLCASTLKFSQLLLEIALQGFPAEHTAFRRSEVGFVGSRQRVIQKVNQAFSSIRLLLANVTVSPLGSLIVWLVFADSGLPTAFALGLR